MANDEKIPDSDFLAHAIREKVVTVKKLPKAVYSFNANKLKTALYKGYAASTAKISYNSPDFRMLKKLHDNIYMFSAAKTFQQTKDMIEVADKMSKSLSSGDQIASFKEFRDKVDEINVQYNENWLSTEYRTANARASNAANWERFEQQKQTLPYLRKVVVEDELTCEICAPLDGITLPVDDPFWDEFAGDLHFNCRCFEEQLDEDDGADNESDSDEVDQLSEDQGEKMDAMFKTNVGKNGEIFDGEHPYFDVPRQYADFAMRNFDLQIPRMEEDDGFRKIFSNDLNAEYIRIKADAQALIEKSREASDDLKQLAESAAKANNAYLSPMSVKSESSIIGKASRDYNNRVGDVNDGVRTTIIAKNDKEVERIVADIRASGNVATKADGSLMIKHQTPDKFLGYSGYLINVKMPNGMIAEVQVNTERMMYAKMEAASGKKMLGDKTFDRIAKETKQPAGLGHKYYEEFRRSTNDVEKVHLQKMSETYYANFR